MDTKRLIYELELVETLERVSQKYMKQPEDALIALAFIRAVRPNAILRLCQAWREVQEHQHSDDKRAGIWQATAEQLRLDLRSAERRADALQRELDALRKGVGR